MIIVNQGGGGVNLYNADGTLTGNRTVTMSGNTLTFSGGTVKTISPSASALDTAFAVRNNTDTANLVKVQGDGDVVFSGNLYAISYQANFYRSTNGNTLLSYDGTSARLNIQTIMPSRMLNSPVTDTQWRSSDDSLLLMRIYDSGKINMPNLPTSSAGLSAGDIWNDGGTLKIV